VAALPAVWLVNREDDRSVRPNVAAVGAPVVDVAASTTPVTIDPMGDVGPQFLASGPATPPAATPVVPVVGTDERASVASASAIFRRSVRDPRTCLYSGVPGGSLIEVVNVANDRAVECWTSPRTTEEPRDEVVLSAAGFAEIADPTAAPIHVEVRLR
jgi:hypothetical protein